MSPPFVVRALISCSGVEATDESAGYDAIQPAHVSGVLRICSTQLSKSVGTWMSIFFDASVEVTAFCNTKAKSDGWVMALRP